MAKKSKTKKRAKIAHPGMMGDGTEEQNLVSAATRPRA